ncbi:deoxyribose-phosphate aldolase [Methanobrevibacter sp. TMH8]|uniref:deoxyribose-phosphate aldolase n=1 Tax=Methanobrevibacter sp. TMH8 TaxID=2848611 RepID=UPI001CCE8209|nr:deoxyribose-phosphate aldolase [Methanobrevibacter sp. TMH8]MBZ9571166.1 deoxyribose-phosphate aldolase [Methanobrevibacter sp. TMH8]
MIKLNSVEALANKIEYTNLKNTATKESVEYLAHKAKEYGFCAIVVSPYYVEYAKKLLKDTNIKVVTVVGFPLGFTSPKSKKKEAKVAIKNGADEIDMVANIQALKSGDYDTITTEIEKVRKVTEGKILKVIIEAELLNDEEIKKISEIASKSGADYIKTSTGLSGEIPKASNLVLIRRTTPNMKVKASGGIKDYKTAIRLVSAGADRLGTSSGDLIIEEYNRIAEQQAKYETKGFLE